MITFVFRVIRRIRKLSTLRALRGVVHRCVSGHSHLSLCSRVYLYVGRPKSLPSRGENATDQRGKAGGERGKPSRSGCKASAPSLRTLTLRRGARRKSHPRYPQPNPLTPSSLLDRAYTPEHARPSPLKTVPHATHTHPHAHARWHACSRSRVIFLVRRVRILRLCRASRPPPAVALAALLAAMPTPCRTSACSACAPPRPGLPPLTLAAW